MCARHGLNTFLTGHRLINTDTALSLQLMLLESHPATHNQGPTKANSGSKEGLSVYGLFHQFTSTPQGKHLLRQYFLRPSKNINVISERLNAVTCFTRPENEVPSKSCRKCLKGIGNVRPMMMQLKRGISAGSGRPGSIALRNWSGLLRVREHADTLKGINGLRLPVLLQCPADS